MSMCLRRYGKAGAGMCSGWNSAAKTGESWLMSALVRTSKTCSKKHMPKVSHHVTLVRANITMLTYRLKRTALYVHTQISQKMYDDSMTFVRMQHFAVCSWLAKKPAEKPNIDQH